jgi:hypothetical protein
MRLETLTREIIAVHSDTLPASLAGAVVCGAQRTSTGAAIVMLGPAGGPPLAVLRVTATAEGRRLFDRETVVLTTLHADQRLGAWRELLPRPWAQGVLRGRYYRLDAAVGGVTMTALGTTDRRKLLCAAAETIAVLHQRTTTTVAGGPALAERWVDAPLRELSRRAGRSRWLAYRLEVLREELHGAVAVGMLEAGWIHGDYWLGNVLFSGLGLPNGIVDWEGSGPLERPFHDMLHLLLYARRLATGRELGQLVQGQLGGEGWSADERAVLKRHCGRPWDDAFSPRHTLLLYWLRHVAGHARQQGSQIGYRYRIWERRNVLPVLAAL